MPISSNIHKILPIASAPRTLSRWSQDKESTRCRDDTSLFHEEAQQRVFWEAWGTHPRAPGSGALPVLSKYCSNIFSSSIYHLGLLHASQQRLAFSIHSEGFCWDMGAISLCFPTSEDACKNVFEGTNPLFELNQPQKQNSAQKNPYKCSLSYATHMLSASNM